MKAVVIAVVVGAGAFAGLFFFMSQKPPAKTDSLPIVSELPTTKRAPADDDAPREKSKPPASKRQGNFPSIGDAPPAKPTEPIKTLHYTIELTRKRGPVPSRVFIHNAAFGNLT